MDSLEIASEIEGFFRRHFGGPSTLLFCQQGVGLVVGATVGTQNVVLKIHIWRASLDGLLAIQRVQSELFEAGLLVARPLVSAEKLGNGIATVETMLSGGVANGRSPEIRGVLARELFRFIQVGKGVSNKVGLAGPALLPLAVTTLWPTPHSPHLDFEGTGNAAVWIDDLARAARSSFANKHDELVNGHMDWRVENVGIQGTVLTAIYDIDSVGVATEGFIVGCAAATFSTNWSVPGGDVPTLEEMTEFVREYEEARGEDFSHEERETVDAANLLMIAYGARCQVSDSILTPGFIPASERSWIELLKERGELGMLTRCATCVIKRSRGTFRSPLIPPAFLGPPPSVVRFLLADGEVLGVLRFLPEGLKSNTPRRRHCSCTQGDRRTGATGRS